MESSTVMPYIEFPYTLDTFQEDSMAELDKGASVIVSAHTSAGKTTVALYAIARALSKGQRVLYTSPIKALSNQKYREFKNQQFGSVGLLTGDITIAPESDCLVMTTEILRAMLYQGAEMLREVGCVIFDEVHYMRDPSRGVVWEETIVSLPHGCQYVFLSATIPNADQFSAWIQYVHPESQCKHVSTDFRPTPLRHFVFPVGGDGLWRVMDDAGGFDDSNFATAVATASTGSPKQSTAKRGGKQSPIHHVIRCVQRNNALPVIVFSFAKAECERHALTLAGTSFNSEEETSMVDRVWTAALASLREEDRTLPCITDMLPLLRNGIGIHHSGLLPVLKELVEVLFQHRLVKCLFATETFSMGLNMPARTVVFASLRKWDGTCERALTGGEYIQMSGRAGRRGIDAFGIVISLVDPSELEPSAIKAIMVGGADPLLSSFHLTYNMILNLVRVEDVDPEYMMHRSFLQFQRRESAPKLRREIEKMERSIGEIPLGPEPEEVKRAARAAEQVCKLKDQARAVRLRPTIVRQFLKPGRMVHVSVGEKDFGWGVYLDIQRAEDERMSGKSKQPFDDKDPSVNWIINVAVVVLKENKPITEYSPLVYTPCNIAEYRSNTAELRALEFSLKHLQALSSVVARDVVTSQGTLVEATLLKTLATVHQSYNGHPPQLSDDAYAAAISFDPVEMERLSTRQVRIRERMHDNPYFTLFMAGDTESEESSHAHHLRAYRKHLSLSNRLTETQNELAKVNETVLYDELRNMIRVLRMLGYIEISEDAQRLTHKGRIACELTTENELILTELLFRGQELTAWPVPILAAVLSTLVHSGKQTAADAAAIIEELRGPFQLLQTVAKDVLAVMSSCNINKGSVESLIHPGLMNATHRWASGRNLAQTLEVTTVYEGDVVRTFRRLVELLRQLTGAARAMDNEPLVAKFTETMSTIKRDVVFAASIYV